MIFKLKRALDYQGNSGSAPTAAEIVRLVGLLREAMGGGVYDDFTAALREIVEHRDEIQKSFLASINLVGVLTHAAERQDPRSGRGWLKKQEVKAAFRYLLKADKFEIPQVPDYLRPYVIDVAVDVSIDFVVEISNKHVLWDPAERSESVRTGDLLEPVWTSIREGLGETLCWLAKVTQPIWGRIVQFFAFLWEALGQRTVLTPELRKVLYEADRAGLVKQKTAGVERAQKLVVWVGDHRDQLKALFELISEAVHVTETLFSSSKSGPEKKAYARDLIMSTLRALGSPLGRGLFSLIAEAIVDSLIDAAVQLFNSFPEKEPAFRHKK
jgi:hypothetical protein